MNKSASPSDRDPRFARAQFCLQTYGAERARWPEGLRALYDLYAADDRFETARREAELLDQVLAFASAPPKRDPSADERLLNALPARRAVRSARIGWFETGALWPAGLAASLAVVSFVAGAMTAPTRAGESAAAILEAAFADAPIGGEGAELLVDWSEIGS
jgi:hypothetical protein